MDTILKSAEDKKFTDFSNAVKAELKGKMRNNPVVKKHLDDTEKISQMKAQFAKINKDHGEPEVPEISDKVDPEEE